MSLSSRAGERLLRHDPRCSKSRAVLRLLEENGLAFTERRSVEEPLGRDELGARVGRPPTSVLAIL